MRNHARRRRRTWIGLLAIEVLLFSGPVLVPQLHVAICERLGLPLPTRFVYVPWMLAAGALVLVGWFAHDLFRAPRAR